LIVSPGRLTSERLPELKGEVAQLKARLNQNSSNSSKPPSSDPPSVKRAPPKHPAGKKRGGQRGHKRHQRDLVPPEKISASLDIKPEACRGCGAVLLGDDPEPLRQRRRARVASCGTMAQEQWRNRQRSG